jgi:hypothetical protein
LQGEVFLEKNTFKTKKFIKGSEFRLQIPYQYLHPKTIYTDCIYRKIHKKSKRQTPENGFALIEKRYHK